MIRGRMRRRAWQVAAALALGAIAVRLWPRPPLRDSVPASTIVWSADGAVLRMTRAMANTLRWIASTIFAASAH